MNARAVSRPARAMTLIELLIVITILLILVSAATTMMQLGLAGREVREAARQFNTVLAGGMARAAANNRGAGVWLERSTVDANACFEVFFAEVPPIYAGDAVTSRAIIPDGSGSLAIMNNIDATLIQPGDLIRFNYQGPLYPIVSITGTNLSFSSANKPKPPAYFVGVPFQIFRQPRKLAINPLQMPAGTVVDLANSGIGSATEFAGATGPVVVLFAPNGTVDAVYYGGTRYPVLEAVHFLVGRIGQTGAVNLGSQPNEMRWISVGHQTGTVLTTENMGGSIANARQYAIAGKGMGGS